MRYILIKTRKEMRLEISFHQQDIFDANSVSPHFPTVRNMEVSIYVPWNIHSSAESINSLSVHSKYTPSTPVVCIASLQVYCKTAPTGPYAARYFCGDESSVSDPCIM